MAAFLFMPAKNLLSVYDTRLSFLWLKAKVALHYTITIKKQNHEK
jgi:hypothetical protein